MDAIESLRADHRVVEGLFGKYDKTDDPADKRRIAQQVCLELMVHTTIEEEVFYSAVKHAIEDDLYNEAFVEHDGAKMMIAEILEGSSGDDFYDAKVRVLSEMFEHHVKEEEQRDGIFVASEGVPPPTTRSMKGGQAAARRHRGCVLTATRNRRGPE